MNYRIAVLPGDGIGLEVMPEALTIRSAVAGDGLALTIEEAEVGAALYKRTGDDLPREVSELCTKADAMLFASAL